MENFSLLQEEEFLDEQPQGPSRLELLQSWHSDQELLKEMRDLLEDGQQYWLGLKEWRDERLKVRDFVRGDHYNEIIEDPDNEGSYITEETLLLRKGRQPIVNNQIRQIHKNLKGQYRNNDYKPQARARKKEDQRTSQMLTAALQYAQDINSTKEIDAHVFDEFLISGAAIGQLGFDWRADRNMMELSIDPVNPARCFWNTDVEHPLLDDLHLFGVMRDVHIDTLKESFGFDDPEIEEYIQKLYPDYQDRVTVGQQLTPDKIDNLNFHTNSGTQSKEVRVYEIWKKKMKRKVFAYDPVKAKLIQYPGEVEEALQQVEMDNEERIMMAQAQGIPLEQVPLLEPEVRSERCWYYYYVTPNYQVLDMGESPYWHEEHPYAIKMWPMIDQQVWGLLGDFIDQQRAINRSLTMLDHVMGTSAKNTLLIPEDVVPKGWTVEEYAEQWTKIGGYIAYTPKPHGQVPKEVSSNSQPANATQLLQIQLQLIKEISGVTEAIQGQSPSSGTPSSLYAQMANNATLSIKDPFEAFYDWKKMRDWKCIKLIQQYYDEPRFLNISGNEYAEEALMYDPEVAGDADFDMVVTKSANSPVYRDILEEKMNEWLQAGLIDLNLYLDNSSLPFAESLKQGLQQRQAQLQEQIQNQPQ